MKLHSIALVASLSFISISAVITTHDVRELTPEQKARFVEKNIQTLFETGRCNDCYLEGADFSYRKLAGAIMVKANLKNANFEGADLTGAGLEDSDCQGANFKKASLNDAALCGTNFTNADLTNANLTLANLFRANFTRAILEGANFTGVTNLQKSIFQDSKGVSYLLWLRHQLENLF